MTTPDTAAIREQASRHIARARFISVSLLAACVATIAIAIEEPTNQYLHALEQLDFVSNTIDHISDGSCGITLQTSHPLLFSYAVADIQHNDTQFRTSITPIVKQEYKHGHPLPQLPDVFHDASNGTQIQHANSIAHFREWWDRDYLTYNYIDLEETPPHMLSAEHTITTTGNKVYKGTTAVLDFHITHISTSAHLQASGESGHHIANRFKLGGIRISHEDPYSAHPISDGRIEIVRSSVQAQAQAYSDFLAPEGSVISNSPPPVSAHAHIVFRLYTNYKVQSSTINHRKIAVETAGWWPTSARHPFGTFSETFPHLEQVSSPLHGFSLSQIREVIKFLASNDRPRLEMWGVRLPQAATWGSSFVFILQAYLFLYILMIRNMRWRLAHSPWIVFSDVKIVSFVGVLTVCIVPVASIALTIWWDWQWLRSAEQGWAIVNLILSVLSSNMIAIAWLRCMRT
ncbi:MAG: hypothetical protein AAF297_04215 [Planctomycetota bacterium]